MEPMLFPGKSGIVFSQPFNGSNVGIGFGGPQNRVRGAPNLPFSTVGAPLTRPSRPKRGSNPMGLEPLEICYRGRMALSLVHVRSEEAPAELPKCLARLVQVTSSFHRSRVSSGCQCRDERGAPRQGLARVHARVGGQPASGEVLVSKCTCRA